MAADAAPNPLVVWLHGAGEGGTDVDIPLLGADATELMGDGIQGYFKKDGKEGAYVLVVQTPTMWMDAGQGQHQGDAGSLYTQALKDAIDNYIASNSDVDPERIFIGGCSNGGYMTVNMIISYPSFFAAGFPVCEAYMDSFIDETKLAALSDTPLWFTQSRDDSTVSPVGYVIPTFVRLLQAGAENVHLSFFDKVVGKDAPGVEYMGHWSWVYALSDRSTLDVDHDYILSNAGDILAECANLLANPQPSAFGAPVAGPISEDLFPASSVEAEGGMWAWLSGF